MNNINQVMLSGNLASDPTIGSTPDGTNYLNFSIAVHNSIFNKKEEKWEKQTDFFKCALYGSRTEFFMKILKKGSRVNVTGKLRQSTWEKDGQKQSLVDILVNEIEPLDSKSENAEEVVEG